MTNMKRTLGMANITVAFEQGEAGIDAIVDRVTASEPGEADLALITDLPGQIASLHVIVAKANMPKEGDLKWSAYALSAYLVPQEGRQLRVNLRDYATGFNAVKAGEGEYALHPMGSSASPPEAHIQIRTASDGRRRARPTRLNLRLLDMMGTYKMAWSPQVQDFVCISGKEGIRAGLPRFAEALRYTLASVYSNANQPVPYLKIGLSVPKQEAKAPQDSSR